MKITDSRFLVNSFLTETLRLIVQKLPSEHVLDLGCGAKPYKSYFQNPQLYVGVDLCSHSADVRGVGEYLPFAKESFDTAICTQVLEHVEDPKIVLEEINRVLACDGWLVLSTHGFWIEGHEKVDLWRWTIQGLRKIFEESGFEVIEVHSMDSFSSFMQYASLYTPRNAIGIPFQVLINLSGIRFKVLGNRGPNIPVVHVLKAQKRRVIQTKKGDSNKTTFSR